MCIQAASCVGVFFSELTLAGTVHMGKRRSMTSRLMEEAQGATKGCVLRVPGLQQGDWLFLLTKALIWAAFLHLDEWEVIQTAEGHIRPLRWPRTVL